MIEHIHALMDEARIQLSRYRDLERSQYSESAILTREGRLERLTLRRNILQKEAWLTWAEEVLMQLNIMESTESHPRVAASL